jgi:bacterioferritin-associated ferredoxin
MAPVFVFVKDVETALKEGRQEILIPEGAKVSPAALDLIRDRGVRVVQQGANEPLSGGAEAEAAPRKAEEKPEAGSGPSLPARPEESGTPGSDSASSISEEELEAIVNRVIDRFRRLKGAPPPDPSGPSAPADDDDMIICRCEEITKGEIKEAIRNGMTTLNGIKRVTRAGMGLCQGQTCQRLVSQILAQELGLAPADVEPSTARAPVRPVRLSVFATG